MSKLRSWLREAASFIGWLKSNNFRLLFQRWGLLDIAAILAIWAVVWGGVLVVREARTQTRRSDACQVKCAGLSRVLVGVDHKNQQCMCGEGFTLVPVE